MKRAGLIFLCVALVLAGCAEKAADIRDDVMPGATEYTNEQGRSMLLAAAEDLPERFSFDLVGYNGADAQVMTMRGAMDDAAGTAYFEIHADPSVMGQDDFDMPEEGIRMFVTEDGVLYLMGGTAYAFPADGQASSMLPTPESNPFGRFSDPTMMFEEFPEEALNVTKVTPTMLRGKAAVAVDFSATDPESDTNFTGTATMFLQPARLGQMDMRMPAKTVDEPSRFVADFYFDGEAGSVTPPPAALRAAGLTYQSDANPFAWDDSEGGEKTVTWTFRNDGGIALSEVELVAFPADAQEDDDGMDISTLPAAWRMNLAEGTYDDGSVSVVFTDADESGTVSPGDTLAITTQEDAAELTYALHDLETGLYVVPGLGPLALLAGLGAAGLLLRRS